MRTTLLLIIASISLGGANSLGHPHSGPSSPIAGQASATQQRARTVEGQVLTSTEMPPVRLKFPADFKYIGAQDFILYDNARAEQHFFVVADGQRRITRLYWVQFEGYLPTNTHTYRYTVNKTVNVGGLEFIADARAANVKTNQGRPDSDGARARAFFENKGYRLASDDVMVQRLVHLVDEAKRNELMIIYMEDMGGTGLTAGDVAPGGRAAAQWEEISKGLLERAVKGLGVER